MKSILVTGSAGFIGSHFTDSLLQQNKFVIGVDNLNDYYNPKWKMENIAKFASKRNFVFIKEDILNKSSLRKIFKKYKPEAIVHLAARAGVRPSIEDAPLYQKVNIEGTLNLFEAAKLYPVKKFVFASSSSVYGNQKKVPFSEDDQVSRPVSPYAVTKLAGEMLAHTYAYLHKIPTICLRFFTVYGPNGRPDMAPYLFTEALVKEKPIKKFGDGSTSRDYTYVEDIVSGINASLLLKTSYEVFNLGNSSPITLNNYIDTLERVVGKKAIIKNYPSFAGDVEKTFADISKAKKLLGYNPKTSLEKGLKKFTLWYKKYRNA